MTGSLVTSWEKPVSPGWHEPLGTSPGWGQPHFSPWNSIFCGFSCTVHQSAHFQDHSSSHSSPSFPSTHKTDSSVFSLKQANKINPFLWLLSPPVQASGVSKMFSIATLLKNQSTDRYGYGQMGMGMATDSLWPRDRYWEQMVRRLNSILMNWKYGHWI